MRANSSSNFGNYSVSESRHTCSAAYDTVFGNTYTLYNDGDGNPGGDTVFVSTDCETNEGLHYRSQDPRYDVDFPGSLLDVRADLRNNTLDEELSIASKGPFADEACYRGCLCSYKQGPLDGDTALAPYNSCNCTEVLENFWNINGAVDTNDPNICDSIYLTQANITMLQYFGFIDCTLQPKSLPVGTTHNFKSGDPSVDSHLWHLVIR